VLLFQCELCVLVVRVNRDTRDIVGERGTGALAELQYSFQ